MARCTECGAAVADDLKFCGYCGAKLKVIGEHLGTQILGNTQVLIEAVAKIAPVNQYVLVGSVTAGPMSGGVVLYETADDGSLSLLWSDGDRLDRVGARPVDDSFRAGSLEWNRELTDRCPRCLTAYHRTRGVCMFEGSQHCDEIAGRYVGYRISGVPSADRGGIMTALTLSPRPGGKCPACASQYLLQKVPKEEEAWQACFLKEASRLDDQVRTLRGMDRDTKQQHRASAAALRKKAAEGPSLPALVSFEERALQDFTAFADMLPALLLEPIVSLDDWRDYQGLFERAMGWRSHYGPRDTRGHVFPYPLALEKDESMFAAYKRIWEFFDSCRYAGWLP